MTPTPPSSPGNTPAHPPRDGFQALVEHAPDIITRFDLELRHLYVSPAIEREVGVPPSAFVGRTHAEFAREHGIPEPFASDWQAVLSRVRDTRCAERIEFTFPTPAGTSVYECHIAPEIAPDGTLVSLLSIGRNITSLRRMETALRDSEEQLRTILEYVPVGVFSYDRAMRITAFNERFQEMANLPAGALEGFAVREIQDARVLPAFEKALRGEVSSYEGPYVTPSGGAMWIVIRIAPLRDGAGEVVGGVGVVEDLTERRRAEQERARALRSEQAARAEAEMAARRARFLSEASALFASSLDYEATLQSLSSLMVPGLADSCLIYLLGDPGEVVRLEPVHADPQKQLRLREWLRRYPPRLDSLILPVARALRTGEPQLVPELTTDSLRAHPEDAAHTGIAEELGLRRMAVFPLRARGRILGALSIGMENGRTLQAEDLPVLESVAARAGLAMDNARLHREVEQALQSRGEVLRAVSHDLRNPLASVLLTATSMLDGPAAELLHPGLRPGVSTIAMAAEQMDHLIEDLVDVVRMEAGSLAIEREHHDVGELCRSALHLLRPIADQQGVALHGEVSPGLPPLWVDGARILRVLSNLIENAIKFSPEGGTVRLRAEPCGGEVCFSVADQGPGVPPEDQPSLFRPFWQGSNAPSRGTGLGLTIARGIVEAHGGRMGVESTPGGGSTFAFTLPAPLPAEERPASPTRAEGPDAGGEWRRAAEAGAAVVLVVDDDAAIRRALAGVLGRAGYRVLEAAEGGEGVALALRHSPALILMDLSMPGLDGWGAVRRLREEAGASCAPVIAFTAQNLSEAEREALERLFDGYLRKPIHAGSLLRAVRERLAASGSAAAPA